MRHSMEPGRLTVCATVRPATATSSRVDEDDVFHLASREKWDAVLPFVESGEMSVNAAQSHFEQCTLLHYAAGQGNDSAARRLLQLGANPHREDAEGKLPMHNAVIGFGKTRKTRESIVAMLPAEHLTRLTSKDSWSVLHMAVALNNVDALVWALAQSWCWELLDVICDLRGVLYTALFLWDVCADLYGHREDSAICRAVHAAFETAYAQRERWSKLRGTWVGAVGCVGGYRRL